MAQRSTEDPRAVYAQAMRRVAAAARYAHEEWDPRNPPAMTVSKRDVAVFLIGLLTTLLFVALFLATGSYPS